MYEKLSSPVIGTSTKALSLRGANGRKQLVIDTDNRLQYNTIQYNTIQCLFTLKHTSTNTIGTWH